MAAFNVFRRYFSSAVLPLMGAAGVARYTLLLADEAVRRREMCLTSFRSTPTISFLLSRKCGLLCSALKQLLLTNEFHSLSRSCLRSTAFMHLRTRGHITVRLVAMTQPQYEEDIRSINRYSEQNGENGFVITITHSISLKT